MNIDYEKESYLDTSSKKRIRNLENVQPSKKISVKVLTEDAKIEVLTMKIESLKEEAEQLKEERESLKEEVKSLKQKVESQDATIQSLEQVIQNVKEIADNLLNRLGRTRPEPDSSNQQD